jgi:hypothetical protein
VALGEDEPVARRRFPQQAHRLTVVVRHALKTLGHRPEVHMRQRTYESIWTIHGGQPWGGAAPPMRRTGIGPIGLRQTCTAPADQVPLVGRASPFRSP